MTSPRISVGRPLRARRVPLALVGLALIVPALGYASAPDAVALPHPTTPRELFVEDFESNAPHNRPVSLASYVGESPVNETYTADRAWLTHCNGTIVAPFEENDNGPHQRSNGCVPLAYANAVQLGGALAWAGAASPDGPTTP